MNYLAHIYLSGNDPQIQLGGFMADAVKGSKYNNYPDAVRFGILLHRKIDTYTDSHPAVLQTVEQLRPVYGKFAGVAADMLYDHFLASEWKAYHEMPLKVFASKFYVTLRQNTVWLPQRFLEFMPIFIRKDRLNSYTHLEHFKEILQKMGEHTALPQKADEADALIRQNYYELKADFLNFFPDISQYAEALRKLRFEKPETILAY